MQVVTRRHHRVAEVAHEDRRAPAVAPEAGGHGDDAVLDALRDDIHEPRLPDLRGMAADVAVESHRPVVVDVDVLDDERFAVDDDPLERRTRLPVGRAERFPAGHAGQQLLQGGHHRAGRGRPCGSHVNHHREPPPSAREPAPPTARRTTCDRP